MESKSFKVEKVKLEARSLKQEIRRKKQECRGAGVKGCGGEIPVLAGFISEDSFGRSGGVGE